MFLFLYIIDDSLRNTVLVLDNPPTSYVCVMYVMAEASCSMQKFMRWNRKHIKYFTLTLGTEEQLKDNLLNTCCAHHFFHPSWTFLLMFWIRIRLLSFSINVSQPLQTLFFHGFRSFPVFPRFVVMTGSYDGVLFQREFSLLLRLLRLSFLEWILFYLDILKSWEGRHYEHFVIA